MTLTDQIETPDVFIPMTSSLPIKRNKFGKECPLTISNAIELFEE
jgi:hypothetical protein